jgi:hypothetical protein
VRKPTGVGPRLIKDSGCEFFSIVVFKSEPKIPSRNYLRLQLDDFPYLFALKILCFD